MKKNNIYFFYLNKILWKILSEPDLFITLPFAIILFPIIIILRPILLIRFGFFHSDRLGHFAVNSEIFFCEQKKFEKIKTMKIDLYYFPTRPCNEQLAKMISRKVIILPRMFIRPFDLVSRILPFLKQHVTGRPSNSDYDTKHVLQNIKLQIPLTIKENAKGREILRKAKINYKKIICIGVRDNSYLKKIYTDQDFSYHDHRNDDINKYVPGIKYLLSKGYTVLRMGSVTNKKLKINHKNFLDYSYSAIKSDFMDVYLSSICKIFISNNTGMDALAIIFRRPVLHVGSIPAGGISTFSNKFYNTMSNYYSLKYRKVLSLSEIFKFKIQYAWSKKEFDEKKIKVLHPTKDEIIEYFKEIHNILDKKKRNKRDLILEKKFKKHFIKYISLYPPYQSRYHNKIKTNFLYSFLKSNKHLFV